MRWRAAKGIDVVDTATAQTVGSLDHLVVDPTEARVVALVCGARVVSWDDASGIGADVVTVERADLLREPADDLERAAVAGTSEPLGRRVISEDGVALGSVLDLEFDPETGTVERLVTDHTDEPEVDGSALLGIGSYAVVVANNNNGQAADGDLSERTKADLYEMARHRDVPGRSSMTKAQLVDALGS
ncbi:MAG: PRC-barrel domain-containing protein [Acidimicrobiia bacterium]|nr:PRC-barrel domain-containing protein [Acidimicrobiia bacterium]